MFIFADLLTQGGDVGFELGFAFSATAYLILRPLEKKYLGR